MIAKRLLNLFKQIWKEGVVPQEFRDATIIHLYKNNLKVNVLVVTITVVYLYYA